MARRVTSKFGVADGLFKENVQEVQQVQEVQDVHEVQEIRGEKKGKTIGSTQGRKGEHLKRINMAFSDANYEFITIEGRRSGARSTTAFVNKILDEYRTKIMDSERGC